MYALAGMRELGDVLLSRIVLKYGSAKKVYELEFSPSVDWERKAFAVIKQRAVPSLLEHGAEISLRLEQLGAHAMTILDEEYPLGLMQLRKSPPILYVLGDLRPEDDYAVAVVGTRQASDSGKKSAHQLAQALAESGITVLSGLALGIDSAAHRGALSVRGRTIAVIGSGLDNRYPRENSALWDRILSEGGAVVSQFPPGIPPKRWNFPQRNWTMSGMAQGTIVVEASHTSGAKIQAEYAAEQGRILFLTLGQVKKFEWARDLAERDKAVVVRSLDAIIDVLRPSGTLSTIPEDLSITPSLIQPRLQA
jgi:DNA processing protein